MPLDPQVQALINQFSQTATKSAYEMTPTEARTAIKAFNALAIPAETVAQIQDRSIPTPAGDLKLRIYTPDAKPPFPVLIYFHDGGFVTGDLERPDALCRAIANRVSCLVVSVDYRLAPEHPFPAAIEDAYAAMQWVAGQATELGADRSRIAVAGESAGGNLAAVVALLARDRNSFPLVSQLLLYPMTDATMRSPSIEQNANEFPLSKQDFEWFYNHYTPQAPDRINSYASPLHATNLQNLPSALIITGEFDPLRDEGATYAVQLQKAGVEVQYSCYPGMIHGFVLMAGVLDGGKQAISEVVDFLKTVFARSSQGEPNVTGRA